MKFLKWTYSYMAIALILGCGHEAVKPVPEAMINDVINKFMAAHAHDSIGQYDVKLFDAHQKMFVFMITVNHPFRVIDGNTAALPYRIIRKKGYTFYLISDRLHADQDIISELRSNGLLVEFRNKGLKLEERQRHIIVEDIGYSYYFYCRDNEQFLLEIRSTGVLTEPEWPAPAGCGF